MRTTARPRPVAWLVTGLALGLAGGAAAGYGVAQLGGAGEPAPPVRGGAADPVCRPGYEPLMSYVDDGPPNEFRLPRELVRLRKDMTAHTLEHGDFDALSEAAVPGAGSGAPGTGSGGPEGRVAVTVPGQDGRTVAVFSYTATQEGWWLTQTSECVDPAQHPGRAR